MIKTDPPYARVCDSARAMAHENNMVWIYPRRKAGEEDAGTPAKGRPAMQLGYSAVAALFDMTQAEAAQRLGISITALKGVSRKLGISRWPYKRVKEVYAWAKTLAPSGLQAGERFRHGSQSDDSHMSASTGSRLPEECPSSAAYGNTVEACCELGNDDLGWLLWNDTDCLKLSEIEWHKRVRATNDACSAGTQAYRGHHEGNVVFYRRG